MKSRRLSPFIILALVFIVMGLVLIHNFNKEESPQYQGDTLHQEEMVKVFSIQRGKYYDEQRKLMGNCTQEYVTLDVGDLEITSFYDSNGSFIGNCSSYRGPGSSGGWKGKCSSDKFLPEDLRRGPKFYCITD